MKGAPAAQQQDVAAAAPRCPDPDCLQPWGKPHTEACALRFDSAFALRNEVPMAGGEPPVRDR